jgi:uncharacterized membrane protein
MTTVKSFISGKELLRKDRVSYRAIRHSILEFIHKDYPNFDEPSFISRAELNEFRERYIAHYLSQEMDELSDLENEVIKSIVLKTSLTTITEEDLPAATFGQRIADKVATFGGSWTFIIIFGVFIFIWICINIFWLANKGYDPYPFILLNLILSCIASMQAPVIMMSQNRQDERDRLRGEKDYQINLKSELEIRTLHEKIDHLIIHQQQELMEMQRVQIEMLSDIQKQVSKR